MSGHTDAQSTSRGHVQVAVAVTFLTLAWVSVAVRMYVRTLMIKNIGWDDWWMLLAAVSTLKLLTLCYSADGRGNRHRSPCTALR